MVDANPKRYDGGSPNIEHQQPKKSDSAASHVIVLSCDVNLEDFLTIADCDEESIKLLSHHRRTSWPMYFFAFSCTLLLRASS